MIVCGWCESPTEPDRCSHCGHDPALPYQQRGDDPPQAAETRKSGRPALDASQIRQRLRIARKTLGADATNAALAEHLDISDTTLKRWLKAE